ncbi:MAG: FtsX-like permease family protein [Spirosomataceae bacterium]
MLRNYLKIAWRNLLKYKLFSFINILGLSLAIPTALMALIQIVNYYEFDNFHLDSEQIVRVITEEKLKNGELSRWASSPFHLASHLKDKLAGIDNAATVVRDFKWVLSNGLKTKSINALYTDKSFFRLFNFPLATGVYPAEPNTMVLTHETAQWFFRDANPVGSVLEHPTYGAFKIVGVLKPFNGQKTQFKTDVMVSMASYLSANRTDDWASLHAHTFIKIPKGQTAAHLDAPLSMVSAEVNKLLGAAATKSLHFEAQYLADISPSKEILKNDPYVQDIRSIYINFGFQLIMIVLAAINYINLTLARSMNRSREVGVRKVMGAQKGQLIVQFLTESVLVSYLSLGFGLILLWYIKEQIHVSWLNWDIDHFGYLILLFFVFNLVLGVVAGASPSLILSSYQPVKVLKGTVSPASFGKIGFQKVLIITQFTIALVYVFFIGHTFHQITYMANDNTNYQREAIFNINLTGDKNKLLANEISTIKDVQKIGYTSLSFGNKPTYSGIKNTQNEASIPAFYYAADHNFIENMGLKIVEGSNLMESNSAVSSSMIVVSQKAVESLQLGSEKDAIGKLIMLNDSVAATVIGVVSNFCHYDYESKIEPIVFQYNPALFKVMCLKTSPVADREKLEAAIENLWKKHKPYQEMNASWLDADMYERYYPYEDMQFAGMGSIVIFVIALLGLIGMLTYSFEKRTKEIGIRKVMGANTLQVIKLMSADFIKLLAIATLIAVPLGIAVGVFMNDYLVFNNGIGYGLMSLLLFIIISIALGAVGYFSWKAAQTNPATTLKAE